MQTITIFCDYNPPSAIIGGVTSAYNCSKPGASGCGGAIATGAIVGGLAGGAASAASGILTGATASVTGAVGLSTGSGALGTISGGIFEGGISGLAASGASYTATWALGNTNWSWGEFGMSMLQGAGVGMIFGGLMNGVKYGMSDGFQWETHKTVLEYAERNNRLVDAAKYVSPGDYEVRLTVDGGSSYNPETNITRLDRTNFLDVNGNFDAEKFYYTAWHEGKHYNMMKSLFENDFGNTNAINLKDWVNKTTTLDFEYHRYAQEYLNTDPYRIKYYNQMSEGTKKKFIEPLTNKALKNNYKKYYDTYVGYGY